MWVAGGRESKTGVPDSVTPTVEALSPFSRLYLLPSPFLRLPRASFFLSLSCARDLSLPACVHRYHRSICEPLSWTRRCGTTGSKGCRSRMFDHPEIRREPPRDPWIRQLVARPRLVCFLIFDGQAGPVNGTRLIIRPRVLGPLQDLLPSFASPFVSFRSNSLYLPLCSFCSYISCFKTYQINISSYT